MDAQQMHATEKHYAMLHHKQRVQWLRSIEHARPDQMEKWLWQILLDQSLQYIADPDGVPSGRPVLHADYARMAELDELES